MTGNPAWPGGLALSKPTWTRTSGYPSTSAFFVSNGRIRLHEIGHGKVTIRTEVKDKHRAVTLAAMKPKKKRELQ